MPITQIDPYYSVGTATFAASTAVTGQGTSWLANVEPGDQIFNRLGQMAVVASVNSDTSITLVAPFAGTVQTAQAYTIYRVPDSVRLENYSQRMVNLLTGGNLASLGGLALAANKLIKGAGPGALATQDFAQWAQTMLALPGGANKLPYLSGANTAALTDLSTFMRTVLDDASGAAALETLGLSAFWRGRMGDADAAAARAGLGADNASNLLAGLFRGVGFGDLPQSNPDTYEGTGAFLAPSGTPSVALNAIFQWQRGSTRKVQLGLSLNGGSVASPVVRVFNDGGWQPWEPFVPSDVYRRSNILGTVSQSSGVATGAIIESGAVGGMYYVRYANGTQVCFGQAVGGARTTAASSIMPAVTITFPAMFAAGSQISVQLTQEGTSATGAVSFILGVSSLTATGVTLQGFNTNGATQNAYLSYIAMGRWL